MDPLTAYYPWYTPYQFAGNKPIAAIDLDGLEEFYSFDGSFIGKFGKSSEIRIVVSSKIAYLAQKRFNLKGITKEFVSDILMPYSQKAYEITKRNEEQIFVSWAFNYRSASVEHVMSLFTGEITREDGSNLAVMIEGTTGTNSVSHSVDPEKSEGLPGWSRWSTIHNHPNGAEMSNIKDNGGGRFNSSGGDVQWAVRNKVRIYSVPRGYDSYYKMDVFDPLKYEEYINKRYEHWITPYDYEDWYPRDFRKYFIDKVDVYHKREP